MLQSDLACDSLFPSLQSEFSHLA